MNFLFLRKWLTITLLMLSLIVVSCGPAANSPADTADEDDAAAMVEDTVEGEEASTSGNLGASGNTTTASGLEYVEIEAGTGPVPQPGDIVSVHYTGTLEDGTKFDSSLDRGQPFQFTLGQGAVIPGWDEGIALMREGGKAQLIIPPALGYGESGSGSIPPNATLIFDVELVEVRSQPKPVEVDAADYTETESGLKYYFIEEGDGTAVQPGDMVKVHAQLWQEDGTLLQSTLEQGAPVDFIQGSGNSIPGLDEALLLMHVGDKAQLVMPPELTGGIPGDTLFIFELELLETRPAPKPTDVDDADFTVTESGLKYYAITEGSGAAPKAGDTLSLNYSLWLEDGTLIDSSFMRGQPLPVVIGSGGTIPGFEEGLLLMKEGGKAQLIVPPDLGYGAAGGGPIPPEANLIFEIEILEIQAGP